MANTLQIDDRHALVFGMDWTVIDSFRSKHEQVAELLAHGAKWQAKFTQNGEENLGTIAEIGRFPKQIKVLSGAAQIAVMEQFAGKTVLVMFEEAGENGNPGLVAAVGLINGNVALDAILTPAGAAEAMAGFRDRCDSAKLAYETAGYTRTLAQMSIPLEWTDLLPKPISRFKQSPEMAVKRLRSGLSTKYGGRAAAVIAIGTAAWLGYGEYQSVQAKKKAAAAAQAVNPEVLYAARSREFLNRPTVLAKDAFPEIRKAIADTPTAHAGWRLRELNCSTVSCLFKWERQGGTFAEFKSAARKEWIDLEFADDGKSLRHKMPLGLKAQKLPDPSGWPAKPAFNLAEGSKWQILSEINLISQLGPTKLEGLPPGVDGSVLQNSPHAIRSAAWEIKPGSSWFAASGFDTSPPNVSYESLIVRVSDNDITFEAKGNVYVK